ncbi:MAG: hypothetical protein ACXVXW_04855 [Mycobacteriaceae bacterium]
MTCKNYGGVIACGPPPGVYKRRVISCPVCERTHRFIVRWDGAWYGTTLYGSCGDTWMDGEMCPRPFVKGWRNKAQAEFRAMWDSAAPAALYARYVSADCDFAIADDDELTKAADEREAAHEAILAIRGGAA